MTPPAGATRAEWPPSATSTPRSSATGTTVATDGAVRPQPVIARAGGRPSGTADAERHQNEPHARQHLHRPVRQKDVLGRATVPVLEQ